MTRGNIQESSAAEQIARFLIENEKETVNNLVDYNPSQSAHLGIILHKFRSLIPIKDFLPIYRGGKKESDQMKRRFVRILKPFEETLLETIELEEFDDGYVSYDSLRGVLKTLEVSID